ncbi:MAG: transglycosylase SLT domain-containing protein [Proteobacteria bacterium]|nr:transglycosylase SLT domain-containing protein [Pseudomonadota bacterium]
MVNAIKTAAARTGVNFAYLLEQAAAESGFDAHAGSKTSSAKGLYQFIESTWLNMVKKYGPGHGMGKYAQMIGADGRVSDPQARREILDLRNDPEKASLLAAEFASENRDYLVQKAGMKSEEVGSVELYLAHFLGAGSAAGFLKAMKENPMANAADIFPRAANANRNVFYDRETGEGRTLAGVYDFFAKKFSSGAEMATPADDTNLPGFPAGFPRRPSPPVARDYPRDLYEALLSSRPAQPLSVPKSFPLFSVRGPETALSPVDVLFLAQTELIGRMTE